MKSPSRLCTTTSTNQNKSQRHNTRQWILVVSINTVYRLFTFRKYGDRARRWKANNTTTKFFMMIVYFGLARLRMIVELFHLHLFFLSKYVRSAQVCAHFNVAGINESNEYRRCCRRRPFRIGIFALFHEFQRS